MSSKRKVQKVLSLMIAVLTTVSLAACEGSSKNKDGTQGGNSQSTSTTATTATTVQKSPVKLRILIQETSSGADFFKDSPVAREIEKQTGVTFEYVQSDETKFKVILAGGDLPDIIRSDPSKYGKQLVTGNLITPMDNLLETNGKDILKNIPDTIDAMRKSYASIGGDKLYFLWPYSVPDPVKNFYDISQGLYLRWDWYKEAGAPAIKTPEDLLKVLADIQKKHPKTESGKTVFGMGMWNDWNLWSYIHPLSPFYGCGQTGRISGMAGTYKYKDDSYASPYLQDPNSVFWGSAEFYYKAYKAGLLDPDSLTQKFDDFGAKASAGQYIMGFMKQTMGNYQDNNAASGKGYMVIPVEGGWSAGGPENPTYVGWTAKCYSISKDCKTPDKAMDLLNYFFSYDGARTLASGVKGVHWDMVDGKPQFKQETIDLYLKGGTDWQKTGIGYDYNLLGLSRKQLNPADNQPVDLFETPEVYAQRQNTTEKDFSAYYGVKYPGEVFQKYFDTGKIDCASNTTPYKTKDALLKKAQLQAPVLTDDMKKVEAKLIDMAFKTGAKAILAKDDAEFNSIKTQAIADFKAAGADDYLKFYNDAIKKARNDVGLEK